MFDAQLIMAAEDDTTAFYSPWFPREADNAQFTAELVELKTSSQLTIVVFHKDLDETGPGTEYASTSLSLNSNGTDSDTWTGLKELVRYRFTCGSMVGLTTSWVLFRVLAPAWYDSVKT